MYLNEVTSYGNLGLVKLCLENGADIQIKDDLYITPLHISSRNGHLEITELLLKNGADVNSKTIMGGTPLHHASMNGKYKIVKLLLENGSDIRSKSEYGTPVEMASNKKTIKVFEYYENSKANQIINFFRIIASKNLANKLRIEPNNLFEPEFFNMRKRMFNIDDSCFKSSKY